MKKAAVLGSVAAVMLLTGCEGPNWLNGILFGSMDGYQEYQQLAAEHAGDIDEDGLYHDPELSDETSPPEGAVHVTFASNEFLDIQYFKDEAHTKAIDEHGCYLMPGESLYAEVTDAGHALPNTTYTFRGFRLVGIDETRKDYHCAEMEGEVIQIPENLDYKEVSVVPWGVSEHSLTLSQPAWGGKILYYRNKTRVGSEDGSEDAVISYSAGDELTADFEEEKPYYEVNGLSDGTTFRCGDEGEVEFLKEGGGYAPLSEVFVLSEEKMPRITVKVDGSCGTEPKFYVRGSENSTLEMSDLNEKTSSETGLLEGKLLDTKIYEGSINAVAGLEIAVSNWSPLEDEAIRLRVEKKDADGKVTRENFYIFSGSGTQAIDTDTGTGTTYFTEMEVEIQRVTGSEFHTAGFTYENAKVEFHFSSDDTSEETVLQDGTFVDDDREIVMKVTPAEGYTLAEKGIQDFKVEDNLYEKTFKFDKLQEEFDKMKTKTQLRAEGG